MSDPKKNKPRPKHRPSQLRESVRALEADKYREGFQDGYRIGLAEGRRKPVDDLPQLPHSGNAEAPQ